MFVIVKNPPGFEKKQLIPKIDQYIKVNDELEADQLNENWWRLCRMLIKIPHSKETVANSSVAYKMLCKVFLLSSF